MKIEKINNIQFMTRANNGVPTGEKNWDGTPKMVYIPNFAEMLRNASCKEEADAIREVMQMIGKGVFDGFAFEVVFMVYAKHWNCLDGKFDGMQWQMFQHPWYVSNGDHVSKETIVRGINKMAEQRS